MQLTTDGLKTYLEAAGAFGADVDYARLVKVYMDTKEGTGNKKRYSPGECCGTMKAKITGDPDMNHVSTSYVERHSLQIRM